MNRAQSQFYERAMARAIRALNALNVEGECFLCSMHGWHAPHCPIRQTIDQLEPFLGTFDTSEAKRVTSEGLERARLKRWPVSERMKA